MNEKILVIDRRNIPKAWLSEKLSKKIPVNDLEQLLPFIEWRDRSKAEIDESVKQIIPYLIVESDEDNRIAIYERKGSEKRIHGLHSVGVGGHVDQKDFKTNDRFIDLILRAAKREVFEEFEAVTPSKNINFLGIINEEHTQVGRTHLGLVFKLKITGKGIPSYELHNLHWLYKDEILKNYKLEMWSEMALELDLHLLDFFIELKLTKDQEKTVSLLEEFLKNDKQIFILKGYAGTGKTTLLKGIAQYLKEIDRLGGLMAPTGRAAKVIKDITGIKGKTIHSSMYDLQNLKTYKKRDKYGNESFKFFFELKKEHDLKNSVFIFDESSMIGNNYSEGEFFRFGSGYLLNDILRFFNVNTNNILKLLFVGDPAQLPPVGSNHSLALDADFFISKELNLNESEMTQVVRQEKNSGILFNAAYYRKLIFSNKVSKNHLDTNFEDIQEISYEELGKTFVSYAPLPNISKSIIISFSNKRAWHNNQVIRELYFPGKKSITEGDVLQVTRNNYLVELLNGEFVTVIRVDDKTTRQSASIWINKQRKQFHFDFREVGLQIADGRIIDVLVSETLLNSKNRGMTSEEMKALYVNFIMRYEKKTGATANRNSTQFKESFRNDPYFNALQVKYGYAITGHKAQGGEWENAFVDFSGRNGLSKDELRWIYTAITRASKKLYVLLPPKKSRFNLQNLHYNIGLIRSVYIPLKETEDPGVTPFHNDHSPLIKRLKYFEIIEKIKETDIELLHVLSKDYQEIYNFKKNHIAYKVTMSHNAKGIFTYYSCNQNDKNVTELLDLIKKPVNNSDFKYKPKNEFLDELFNWVKVALKTTKLSITNIDESRMDQYQIVYSFRAPQSDSYIQFYFNKNNRISSLIAKSTIAEKDFELRKLITNLTQNTSNNVV